MVSVLIKDKRENSKIEKKACITPVSTSEKTEVEIGVIQPQETPGATRSLKRPESFL